MVSSVLITIYTNMTLAQLNIYILHTRYQLLSTPATAIHCDNVTLISTFYNNNTSTTGNFNRHFRIIINLTNVSSLKYNFQCLLSANCSPKESEQSINF